MGFAGTTRYQLVRELGAGGMGVVYEARDTEQQARIALKTLKHLDAQSLYRFKREFRALKDLAHPNLLRLHDLVEDGGHWFFTMELIDGVDFIEHVRPGGRLHSKRIRRAIVELASGLHALHQAGKVHRDVKPPNVLVDANGRVVLLDFGLIRDTDGAASADSHVVGTPIYMAPEQALGQQVEPAADLYAVGVLLYEALTGRVPLAGNPVQVLMAKQTDDPPAPSELAPEIPAELDELCRALLSRAPEARPTAAELIDRFGAEQTTPAPAEIVPAYRTQTLPFVGREAELSTLEQALAQLDAGQTSIAVIRGESGIGKSALLRELIDRAGDRAIVLGGRCYEREAIPYRAMDGLVDALSHTWRALPPEEAAALLPRGAAYLPRLFPVLGRVPQVAGAPVLPEIAGVSELRTRSTAALREVLQRIGDRRRLVLWLDDMQWADADTLALLPRLVAPPGPPQLLLVVGLRPEGAAEDLERRLRSLGLPYQRVDLRPLLPEPAQRLAEAMLGDARLAKQAAREAGGSPFFIAEYARYLQSEQAAHRGNCKLAELLAGRADKLAPAGRTLLELVAVAGEPIDLESLATASGLPLKEVVGHARSLRAACFLRSAGHGDAVSAYHDRIREAIVAALTAQQRRDHHRQLAGAFAGTGYEERLAQHWAGAGDRVRAGAHAARAAEDAAAQLAFDRAARFYRLALDLGHGHVAGESLLREKLASALANAGRGFDSAEEYLQAMEGRPEPDGATLRLRAAEQYLISGHLRHGAAELRNVLPQLGIRVPTKSRHALLRLAISRARIRLRGLRFRQRREPALSVEEHTRLDALATVGRSLSLIDTVQAAEIQARYVLRALASGIPFEVARAVALEAGFVGGLGGIRARSRALALLERAETIAEQDGHPYLTGVRMLSAGIVDYCHGEWESARRILAQAESWLSEKCTGATWEFDSARTFGCWSEYYLGEFRQFHESTISAFEAAKERGDRFGALGLGAAFGLVAWLANDDVEGAGQVLDEVRRLWVYEGFQLPHYWFVLAHSVYDLYRGDVDAIWPRLRESWRAARRSKILHIQISRLQFLQLRGVGALLESRRGTGAERAHLLRAAARDGERLVRERVPAYEPLGLLLAAGVDAARGDTERAVERMQHAEQALEARNMPAFAEASRLHRGRLVGGDAGAELVAAATRALKARGVARPEPFASMLVPGFAPAPG